MTYNFTDFESDSLKQHLTKVEDFSSIDENPTFLIIDYSNIIENELIVFLKDHPNVNIVVIDNNYYKFRHYNLLKVGIMHYIEVETNEEFIKVVNLHLALSENHNIQLNIKDKTVFIDEHKIKLTKKEFIIFKYLSDNRGEICNRKNMIEEVMGYHESSDTRIVDVYIKYLRSKLLDEGKKIKTIRGIGYIYEL